MKKQLRSEAMKVGHKKLIYMHNKLIKALTVKLQKLFLELLTSLPRILKQKK